MDEKLINDIWEARGELSALPAPDFLRAVLERMGPAVIHANSLGVEDAVICDMLSRISKDHRSFTLDTGRLNPESYELLARLEKRYGIRCRVVFPDREDVEKMVAEKGINLFHESVENRKLCCRVRKVEPLKRALAGYSGWICGLRRGQALTREGIEKIAKDPANGGIIKLSPLADWSRDDVWEYVKANAVPYNRLHDAGYPSIGCAPCTRAVKYGEPDRAGRWWWENPETKECGLHRRT